MSPKVDVWSSSTNDRLYSSRTASRPMTTSIGSAWRPTRSSKLLDPRATWNDAEAYDLQARELAEMFRENFEKFRADAGEAVAAAGPRI